MSVKRNRSFWVEQAIKEYNKKTAPEPEKRNYVQEETNAFFRESYNAGIKRANAAAARNNFLKESKEWMLEQVIYKIFNEALGGALTEDERAMISDNLKHAMIYNFIRENGGVNKLIDRFRVTDTFLSEIAHFVEGYHEVIVSEAKKGKDGKCMNDDGCSYKIPSDVEEEFYKGLNSADFGDVTIQISNRVVDAIDKFVTDNVDSMNNIKEILTTTKEKIAGGKLGVKEESASLGAKRRVANIKNNRSSNVFGAMMEHTARSIMKDDKLREAFTENGRLDIGRVKVYCAASYTMLETANTARMINVDEEYIRNVIDSI